MNSPSAATWIDWAESLHSTHTGVQWFPDWDKRAALDPLPAQTPIDQVVPIRWAAQPVETADPLDVQRWLPGLLAFTTESVTLALGFPSWVESESISRKNVLEAEPVGAQSWIRLRTMMADGHTQEDYLCPDPRWSPGTDEDPRQLVLTQLSGPVAQPAVIPTVCQTCDLPIGEKERFCRHCGARRPEPCPSCGYLMLDSDRFCAECGKLRQAP